MSKKDVVVSKESLFKGLVKSLQGLDGRFGRMQCFEDWCTCLATSLYNSSVLEKDAEWQKMEDVYLSIIRKYNKEDQALFSSMSADLIMLFELEPYVDYLGKLYMELYGGNKHLGQIFTPTSVSDLISNLCLGSIDEIKSIIEKEHRPITISDPCCGSGSLLLSACKYLYDNGVNYQKHALFYAQDIDSLCVSMCYIQLSLSGARAIITHGNSLNNENKAVYKTPMESLYFKLQCA